MVARQGFLRAFGHILGAFCCVFLTIGGIGTISAGTPPYQPPVNAPLMWSTYLGGSDFDSARDVAVDAESNVYVVGYTRSTDFPVINWGGTGVAGADDAFVAKFSAEGQLLWSGILGADNFDYASGVAVDRWGEIYVV